MTSNSQGPDRPSPRAPGLRRTVVAGLTAGLVVGSFVAGHELATAGSDPRPAAESRETSNLAQPVLANASLHGATSCDQLRQWYVDRGLERVTPWGWDWGGWQRDRLYDSIRGELAGDAGAAHTAPSTSIGARSKTGTTTQEAGVDEPDLVKTNGTLLVRVRGDRLLTYDVTGDQPQLLSSLPLGDLADAELLLHGDTVIAIGESTTAGSPGAETDGARVWPGDASATEPRVTRIETIDLSDPTAPTVATRADVDSGLVSARISDGVVRLVLTANLPDLDFVQPARWRPRSWALKHNRQLVRETTVTDWLPQVTTYDVATGTVSARPATALVDCADVAIPTSRTGLGTVTVAGFAADSPADWSTSAVATDSTIAYLSRDRLYLATNSWAPRWGRGGPIFYNPPFTWGPRRDIQRCCAPTGVDTESGTTELYAFALEGNAARFVASGEVEGNVADRWAMDEVDGVLRVAVGPTEQTGRFNSIITLTEQGDSLEELGRIDRLGVGEQMKAVRWFDDLALVVTFREVDPLYAVDLSAPSAPRLIGKLKIPGFSSYLHPLGQRRVIGMGSLGAGAQAALFDVSDLRDVRRLNVVTFGRSSWPQAAGDPRQFTWMPGPRVALTVISQGYGRNAAVATMRVEHGQLTTSTVRVEYGADVARVRLVPLPGQRVVLVTGEDVRFFDYSPQR